MARRCAIVLALLITAAPARAQQYGFVNFPRDEHQHIDGWDYWWGAADLVTASGNRYTVGIAFDSFDGYGATGHQVFPRQGPYKGRSIMTEQGPAEWGHPGDGTQRFVSRISTYLPGVSELLDYQTLDVTQRLRLTDRWQRTSRTRESYRLLIDNTAAKVHPSGERVKLLVDLRADMHSPPLLLGGTGRWWYGIPQTFKYPSRSFQYMQSAASLTGTLDLQQPGGSVLHETVVPERSTLVMVHEYDATPEDLFAGLALAEATQLHPRYPTYYSGGMPWDLIFVDLHNGAQLMVAVLAFHETPQGTLTPIVGKEAPTYKAMATLRLPSGESVALDDKIHIEHLSRREIVGKVPTFAVQVLGVYEQDWDYRVSYPGSAKVPAFDLALSPQLDQSEPLRDDKGNGLTQRVPFLADGSYDGCPVHGFGWSELIINWYGKEDRDPWWTGGPKPPVPERCGAPPAPPSATTGVLSPPRVPAPPPQLKPEGCTVYNPGAPRCEYDATIAGGVGGYGSTAGGWKVTITRPGRLTPIVVTSFSGQEMYACGTIRPGDHVLATAQPGSGVVAGNPSFCF